MASFCLSRVCLLACGCFHELFDALAQGPGQKSFTLTTKVDAALISGITVEFGDKFMDLSVASQLKKLQALLFDGV
jgi:F0F1-type ATP synthase delta subunit